MQIQVTGNTINNPTQIKSGISHMKATTSPQSRITNSSESGSAFLSGGSQYHSKISQNKWNQSTCIKTDGRIQATDTFSSWMQSSSSMEEDKRYSHNKTIQNTRILLTTIRFGACQDRWLVNLSSVANPNCKIATIVIVRKKEEEKRFIDGNIHLLMYKV